MKLAIFFLSLALCVHAKLSMDMKCSVCENVFLELQKNLAKEVQGKRIDLRGRLDSKGQRQGKIVDYKTSESRIDELLSPVCSKMGGYSLWTRQESDLDELQNKEFTDSQDDYDYKDLDSGKRDYMEKAVTNYCDMYIEEYEDDLAVSIRKDISIEDMTTTHCKKLCKKTIVKREKWAKQQKIRKEEKKRKRKEEEEKAEEEKNAKKKEKKNKVEEIKTKYENILKEKLLEENGEKHEDLEEGLVHGSHKDVEVQKSDNAVTSINERQQQLRQKEEL